MNKFKFQPGDEIVRTKGIRRGHKAKVFWVGERTGIPVMHIRYDNGLIVCYCSPRNFILSREWKEMPYKPKRKSIDKAKRVLTDEDRIIKEIGEKYVPLFYDRINPRLLRYLVDQGFLEKSGTLSKVLKIAGLSWEEYRDERAKRKLPWFEANVSVYKILRDINELSF